MKKINYNTKLKTLLAAVSLCMLSFSTIASYAATTEQTDTVVSEATTMENKAGTIVKDSSIEETQAEIVSDASTQIALDEAIPFVPVSTLKTDTSSRFGAGRLTMLANKDSNAQNLSVIVETGDGGMIIVDGGLEENADSLLSEIKTRGGHVYAWLITHPHKDHALALAKILDQHASEITIDGVYYNFFEDSWYEAHDAESYGVLQVLRPALAKLPEEKLHGKVRAGEVIDAGSAKIQVLNDPYESSTNSGNNASVCYTISLNGTNAVFLGDLALAGGAALLDKIDLRSIKADICQVAHHGQEAVSYTFYQQLAPRVFLWPTPQWLWDNDNGGGKGSGRWTSIESTKKWQSGLLIREYYVTKDGDIVLE